MLVNVTAWLVRQSNMYIKSYDLDVCWVNLAHIHQTSTVPKRPGKATFASTILPTNLTLESIYQNDVGQGSLEQSHLPLLATVGRPQIATLNAAPAKGHSRLKA